VDFGVATEGMFGKGWRITFKLERIDPVPFILIARFREPGGLTAALTASSGKE
jgi:hypothetical protein